mgnify:CR=1 FL=1
MTNVQLKGMENVNSIEMTKWFEMNLEVEQKVMERTTEELAQALEEYAQYLRNPEDGYGDERSRLRRAQEKYDAIVVMYNCIWWAFNNDPLEDESDVIAEALKYAENTSDAEVAAAIKRIVEVYNEEVKHYKEWRHIK